MTVPGVQVENILSVTATADGEHIIAVFGLRDGKEETLTVVLERLATRDLSKTDAFWLN